MKRANWVRVSERFQLRLEISGGTIYKFDGFQKSQSEKVSHVLNKKLGLTVKNEELSTKGFFFLLAFFFALARLTSSFFQVGIGESCKSRKTNSHFLLIQNPSSTSLLAISPTVPTRETMSVSASISTTTSKRKGAISSWRCDSPFLRQMKG